MMRKKLLLLTASVLTCLAVNSQAAGVRTPSMLANTCAGCHGTDGASAGDAMPNIGGFDKGYLTEVLIQFKTGERDSSIMGRIMRGYSDQEIKAIASHFSSKAWSPTQARVNSSLVSEGSQIHREKCETCHAGNGKEQDDDAPRLAGQWPDYLYNMLSIFHDIGSPASQPRMMRKRVQKLSEEEIRALSHFYAAQQ